MAALLVELEPRGAFHFGERGIGHEEAAEILHADTLFSALCAAWVWLYGEDSLAEELLSAPPPFLLSSGFPYAGTVRFYPPPLAPLASPALLRKAKDVAWCSEEAFRAWLAGRVDEVELRELHEGTVWLTDGELERLRGDLGLRAPERISLWAPARVPRVTLDVPGSGSALWHYGRVWFRKGCGLYFVLRFLESTVEEKLKAALRLLGDVGLGGDRTVGHGLFRPAFRAAPDWLRPEAGERFVTLSPVFPASEQAATLLAPGCRYRFLVRSGWIGGLLPSPCRRRKVRLLGEGSVLGGDPRRVWGMLADVTPAEEPLPHRVYRWGYAFPVGVG